MELRKIEKTIKISNIHFKTNYNYKKFFHHVILSSVPLVDKQIYSRMESIEEHPEGNVLPHGCFDFSYEATETTNRRHRCLSGLANPCRPDMPVFFFVSDAFQCSMDQCK